MTHAASTLPESNREFAAPQKRRSRRRILVWIVGTVVIGGMLIAVLLPSLCQPLESANRVKCASNLRQIAQAITLYAQSNGGNYPASLAALTAQGNLLADVMICPSSSDEKSMATDTAGVVTDVEAAENSAAGHKHCLSYIYTGRGLNAKTVSAETIVAYEPFENHGGDVANVLFGDGHVENFSKKSWPSVAAAGGVKLGSSPTTQP